MIQAHIYIWCYTVYDFSSTTFIFIFTYVHYWTYISVFANNKYKSNLIVFDTVLIDTLYRLPNQFSSALEVFQCSAPVRTTSGSDNHQYHTSDLSRLMQSIPQAGPRCVNGCRAHVEVHRESALADWWQVTPTFHMASVICPSKLQASQHFVPESLKKPQSLYV